MLVSSAHRLGVLGAGACEGWVLVVGIGLALGSWWVACEGCGWPALVVRATQPCVWCCSWLLGAALVWCSLADGEFLFPVHFESFCGEQAFPFD